MARKTARQQELRFGPRRGGKRKGAGRKPNDPARGAGVSHRPREALTGKHPVHVTLRVHRDVPNLRRVSYLADLMRTLRAGNLKPGFRLCHFVVMGNHLHLIVEADDATSLARGIQGLSIRLARQLNRMAGRRGRFFSDRYHAHVLRTPTETHRALSYVLLNQRKHAAERSSVPLAPGLDAFSSGAWFEGWHTPPPGAARIRQEHGDEPPIVPATVWLLTDGWRRAGTIP